MTKEEIVDSLEIYTIGRPLKSQVSITVKELQGFIDAIKALKQEPCEDCISRQAVLKTISELNAISFYEAQEDSKECYYEIRQAIENEPPVTPQQKISWIPVSERLPKPRKYGIKDNSDWVDVTILIGKNKDAYVGEAYYCFSENKWYTKRFATGEVIAWQPRPKPYKAESEE